MTKKQVERILKTVMDPELGINIVDLGLVYEIRINEKESPLRQGFAGQAMSNVRIVMTLTTPGCPLGGWFVEKVRSALSDGLNISEEEIMVEISFDPPWSQELMSEEAKAQLGF